VQSNALASSSEFTEEEKKTIEPFFTNLDKSVFVLQNLPEVVKGALFSRYSRSDKSLRKVLLDEFILKPEMGFKEIVGFQVESGVRQEIAVQKAEEFYDRVLVGYGDDSVAELGGAHIACENVSNIASKVLEEPRIGLSPLEKSTRYVWFDKKNASGEYKYYREPGIMASEFAEDYLETGDFLFDTYAKLVEPVKKFVIERFPQEEGVSERAFSSAVKAKACDIIRGLLPASTLTNVGIFGNGRAFEYLLVKMYASDLVEMNALAKEMHDELSKNIPSFVKRSNDRYGQGTQNYLKETRGAMEKLAKETLPDIPSEAKEVTLVDYDEDALDKTVSAILYSYSQAPFSQIKETVLKMGEEEKKKIFEEYVSGRQNRRHKAGRAFEHAHYTFDLLTNYGIYRDLQRHRMLTQEKQLISTRFGFDLPKELVEAGLDRDFAEAMGKAKETFNKIEKKMPKQAQYAVPLAYKMRWYAKMNLREVYHFCELRSSQQGHPDYRRVAQEIYRQVKSVHPILASQMKFVDLKEYGLERMDAEKKTDEKLKDLEKKYG